MAYRPKYDYLRDEKQLKAVIAGHTTSGSISILQQADIPQSKLIFQRAENELKHAEAVFKISGDSNLKQQLELLPEDTFYSGTIAHAYYAIFFAAKALLLRQQLILTKSPNIHKATLDAFTYYLVMSGSIDVNLLKIYQSAALRADTLLGIFVSEKEKRGTFTYQTLPDANKLPAAESLRNAVSFVATMKRLLTW